MPEGENTPAVNNEQNQSNVPAGAGTNTDNTLHQSNISTTIPQNNISNSIPSAEKNASVNFGLVEYSGSDEGEDLYSAIAKLAPFEYFSSLTMDTGENLKISCFIVDKFNIRRESSIFFKYGQDIKSISIENSLHAFGTRAGVMINDGEGTISSLLEYQMNLYFVICIFNSLEAKDNEDGSKIEYGVLYQPYIFDIEGIELISPDNSPAKVFKITLCDIISSTLKHISYGNLLLEQPGFPNLNNFNEVYQGIIDYAAMAINLLHDKKYKISRDIYLAGSINDKLNPIIKDIVLRDVTIDTPLFVLMNRIYSMGVRELEVPPQFAKKADVRGMVLTPLFLNDEWEDMDGYYRTYYKDHDTDKIFEEISYSGEGITINAAMYRRNLYLKHLQMPFQLAFCEKNPHIYETFNPKFNSDGTLHQDELEFAPLNGYTISQLKDAVEIPVDAEMSAMLWKNIAIMSDGAIGSANALIYYNWILEYYKSAYLNYEDNFIKEKFNKETIPPINPYFLRLEKLNLTGGDKEKFAKINSVTARLRSSDPVKEAFWYVGRGVKAYVMLNSLFGFQCKGNIIRHPGEIIKINYASGSKDGEILTSSVPIGGSNTIENGYVLAYVTQVIHELRGNEYIDIVHATKICSVSDKEEKVETNASDNKNQ